MTLKERYTKMPILPDDLLLSGYENMYGIYRPKDTKENEQSYQRGLLHPLQDNHKVYRENYELVYIGEMQEYTTFEKLVDKLRGNPPDGFPENGTRDGHIIAFSQDGNVEFYFTEEYGAVPIEEFADGYYLEREQYNNVSEEEIISFVRAKAKDVCDEINGYEPEFGLKVVGAKIYGSRENGSYRTDSDIDVLLEYEGDFKESEFFNLVNDSNITLSGMKVDINPIRVQESGTIGEFLLRDEERRMSEKQELRDVFFESGDVLIFKDKTDIRSGEEYHIIDRQKLEWMEEDRIYDAYAVTPNIDMPGTYDLEYPFGFSIGQLDCLVRNDKNYVIENGNFILKEDEDLPTRLLVDMDGVLTKFKQVDTLEVLYEKGYFLNLEPVDNVINAVKLIKADHPEIEVYILSSVLADSKYALEEKNEWLNQYLPEIDASHRLFPPCGVNKADYVPGGARETDYLLDDYTHNLTAWEPPARGIKLLNGINHTKETWNGNMLRFDKEPRELAANILSVMSGERIQDVKPQAGIDVLRADLQMVYEDVKKLRKELDSIQTKLHPVRDKDVENNMETTPPVMSHTKNETSPKL